MENETKREFKGVWIPKDIWLDNRLNILEKCILIEIDSLDLEEAGCYASNKYLAEFCQCSESKVSTAISKLIKLGLIEIKSFDGRTRILKSRLLNFKRQTMKFCKSDYEILKENNINNNKDNNINDNNTLKESINTKESNDMAMTCHSTTTAKSTKETKHKYGEYKNVLLTDTELSKLQNEYGETETQNAITYLDEYVEMKGTKYKSHYLAIRKWVFDALKRHKKEEEKGNSMWETLNKVFEDE